MILGAVGTVIALVAVTDVYITTISMRGAGPLSGRVMSTLWRPAVRSTRFSHWALQVYGSLMLPLAVAMWATLLYVGFTLVCLGDPDGVVRDERCSRRHRRAPVLRGIHDVDARQR